MKLCVSLAAGFACAVAARHHSKFISQLARVDRPYRVGASESWDDLYDRKSLDAQIKRIAYSKKPLAERAVVPLTKGRHERGSGDCTPNVDAGDVPLPSGNTWEDFADFSTYNIFSKAANIPAGYSALFENLNATIISPSYMGVHTLSSYDSQSCADLCDSTMGCKSINVFISRDPSVDPGVDCPNPEAIANYYCALYGDLVSDEDATNYGQHLQPTDSNGQDFVVVLRASNAYTKHDNNPGHIPGFKGPFDVPAGMNVSTAEDGLLASVHFITPTDPHLCADLCTNINLAKAYGAYGDTPCSYFNTYELTDKDTNSTSGFYCAIFSETFLEGTFYDGKQVGKKDAAWNLGNSYGYERISTINDAISGNATISANSTRSTRRSVEPREGNHNFPSLFHNVTIDNKTVSVKYAAPDGLDQMLQDEQFELLDVIEKVVDVESDVQGAAWDYEKAAASRKAAAAKYLVQKTDRNYADYVDKQVKMENAAETFWNEFGRLDDLIAFGMKQENLEGVAENVVDAVEEVCEADGHGWACEAEHSYDRAHHRWEGDSNPYHSWTNTWPGDEQ